MTEGSPKQCLNLEEEEKVKRQKEVNEGGYQRSGNEVSLTFL